MRLLAVESSAVSAGAAVLEDGRLLGETYLNTGHTHSETLLPMVEELLLHTGKRVSEMDCLAVAKGPGSFTGVRIGVALVKGLAFPEKIPCVGVSTLEAMAYQLCGMNCVASCVMDARRSQVYHALFRVQGGRVERLKEDEAVGIDSLREEIQNYADFPYVFIGDGASLCYNTLAGCGAGVTMAPPHLVFQRAAGVALAAQEAYLRGEAVDGGQLVPSYLRMAQAERELKLKKESGQKT